MPIMPTTKKLVFVSCKYSCPIGKNSIYSSINFTGLNIGVG